MFSIFFHFYQIIKKFLKTKLKKFFEKKHFQKKWYKNVIFSFAKMKKKEFSQQIFVIPNMNLKKILSIFFDIFEDKFNKVYSKKIRKSLFENNTMTYF